MTKIGFVGAGKVGSTAAYATAVGVNCDEIAMVDIIENLAVGEAMDIETAGIAAGKDVVVRGGSDYSLIKDSDIVVVSAGLARKPGMSRLDLTKSNAKIITDIVKQIMTSAPNTIILMVTNPLDVMTYVAYKVSGRPRSKIIGMGSIHDTARLVAELKSLGATDIHAMMAGEHGDSMFPLKSQTKFAGMKLTDKQWSDVIKSVRDRAMKIIKRKGGTNYTPAECVVRILRAIVDDERVELPINAVLDGEYGLRDVVVGVPAIVGREGLIKIVEYELTEEELAGLRRSADVVKGAIKDLEIGFDRAKA